MFPPRLAAAAATLSSLRAAQLCMVLYSVFSCLSLRISVMWETSCLVPNPKRANMSLNLDNDVLREWSWITGPGVSLLGPLPSAWWYSSFYVYIYSHLKPLPALLGCFLILKHFNTVQHHMLNVFYYILNNTSTAWILDHFLSQPQFVPTCRPTGVIWSSHLYTSP